jgi:hypothetical protein
MNRNLFLRKYLAIGIVLSFVGISAIPSLAKPETIPPSFLKPKKIFFGLQTNINMSWDKNLTDEIFDYLSSRQVPLTIKFWVTWGLLGRLINLFYWYHTLYANFRIINSPWSDSALVFNQLPLYIPPKQNIQQVCLNQLIMDLDWDTPAYEMIPITIETKIEPIIGPSGTLVLIRGLTNQTTIYAMVKYRPSLSIDFPEGQTFETPPLSQLEVPVEIYNSGNGKTLVENEVYNQPSGWNVSLPSQFVMEQNEETNFIVTLMAPSNFSGYENIVLKFTPHYYYNYSEVGGTYFEYIQVHYNP